MMEDRLACQDVRVGKGSDGIKVIQNEMITWQASDGLDEGPSDNLTYSASDIDLTGFFR